MEMEAALASLAALGHESRLRAFRHLVEAGSDGMPVGEHHRRQQEDFSQEERIGHHQLFVNFTKAQNLHRVVGIHHQTAEQCRILVGIEKEANAFMYRLSDRERQVLRLRAE